MQAAPLSPRGVALSDVEGSDHASSSPGGNTVLFPWKVQDMLRSSVGEGKECIVSWLPHGTAFKVHNVPVFVSEILPLFFKQTKYKSFQRQLNLWGFKRIESGPEKGAYFHKHFLRDKPNLCSNLTRQRAKRATAPHSPKETKSTLLPKKRPSKSRSVPPIPSIFYPIPRNISEGSVNDLNNVLEIGDVSIDTETRDLADFEGFSFHLLEQDRCEELNPELKVTAPEENGCQELLEDLEIGFFGLPKTAAYEMCRT